MPIGRGPKYIEVMVRHEHHANEMKHQLNVLDTLFAIHRITIPLTLLAAFVSWMSENQCDRWSGSSVEMLVVDATMDETDPDSTVGGMNSDGVLGRWTERCHWSPPALTTIIYQGEVEIDAIVEMLGFIAYRVTGCVVKRG